MNKRLLSCLVILLLFSGIASAQISVSGRVTGTEAEPLIGVGVSLKGTSKGTITDFDGKYTLDVPSTSSVLVFTFLGYKAQEVTVGNSRNIAISLEEDISALNEVVVVGYGTQLKREVTGSISKLKSEEFEYTPVNSVEQVLQGRTAGVFVESNNGKLGAGIKMRIRGATSISGSNEPLYVVDGVIITSSLTPSAEAVASNPLADLNFNDIESIEVLKDAAAAAIYGSRGANGVVLITTKSGKSGKTKFAVNYQNGWSTPTRLREFLNTSQYIELLREAAINSDGIDGLDPVGNPDDYPGSWLEFAEGRLTRYSGSGDWETQNTETDWQSLAFQDAPFNQIDVSASGGTEKTRFFVSTQYSDQNGILIGNRYQRIGARMNLDHQANNWLNFGLNVNLTNSKNFRVADDNQFTTPMQIVALAPITPVRDPDGEYYDRPVTTYYNPLLDYEYSDFISKTFRNIGNLYGEAKLTSNLSLRGEFGYDILTQNDDRTWGVKTLAGLSTNGASFSRWLQMTNLTTKALLNYNDEFGLHGLNVVAGIETQNSREDITSVTGIGFPVDDLKRIASAATITAGTSFLSQFGFVSYVARANYKFNNKYFFSLSGRVDGSSRFGENERFGFFPAVSAAWLLSDEEFIADMGIFNLLKLRASWGVTGNAGIGNFSHLGLYGGNAYGGLSGLSPNQIPNPDLTWEETSQINVGLDFAMFDERLTVEFDYYNKITDDLLQLVPVPGTTGFGTQLRNVGKMSNKGVELVLTTANIRTNTFNWTTSLNFSRNRNEVLRLNADQQEILSTDSRYINAVIVGQPIGVFYGPEFAGADVNNGDALFYIVDEETGEKTTTNSINDATRQVIGDPNPKFIGGITNTLSFKGIELSFMFQGVYGNDIYNAAGGFMSASFDWFDNQTIDQLDRWQNPGDVTNVPQLRLGYGLDGIGASSRYISDGSYLRLKSMTLAYNFPSQLTNRLKLDNLRIFVQGYNLLTFTNYDGWDPEVNTDYLASNIFQGNDFYAAPQPKTITFGVNVGF
ncbi:MAG: TonB-dependent receptor [Saprospiraceae bacterium]|nr:TonB-dependent receptor [Saprospiraceae bacterium]